MNQVFPLMLMSLRWVGTGMVASFDGHDDDGQDDGDAIFGTILRELP